LRVIQDLLDILNRQQLYTDIKSHALRDSAENNTNITYLKNSVYEKNLQSDAGCNHIVEK